MMRTRIFGLDILRCFSISGILFCHFVMAYYPNSTFEWFARVAPGLSDLCMSIFFVLSGFLVCNILIRKMTAGDFKNFRNLFQFWISRWLRTLPLYYLFIFFYFATNNYTNDFSISSYFLFGFNLFKDSFSTFALGSFWSLSIEEYFYFLFPVIVLCNVNIGFNNRSSLYIAVVFFFVTPIIFRYNRVPVADVNSYLQLVRNVVLARLDSIAMGICASVFYNYRTSLWHSVLRCSSLAMINLIVIIFSEFNMSRQYHSPPANFITQMFGYTYFDLSVLLVLPYFVESAFLETVKWLRWVITGIAKISYSVYVLHFYLIVEFMNWFKNFKEPLNNCYQIIIIVGVIVVLSTLTYRFIELPFMRLRKYIC